MTNPLFRSAFESPEDERRGLGKRPVVIDILGPDRSTSILPDGVKMVLHVNPATMKFTYTSVINTIQTEGGYVEQHWAGGSYNISFDIATGGFMRLYSGLSNTTGGPGSFNLGGTRRETIAYDKYLDLLAVYHNNGRVYDINGKIAFQGIIKITFDGQAWFGWFNDFNVSESAEKPYMFNLTANFTVDSESMPLKTIQSQGQALQASNTARDFVASSISPTSGQSTTSSPESSTGLTPSSGGFTNGQG